MKKSWWLLLAALSLVCSCAQRIKMQVSNPGYQTDSVTTPVRVLSLNDTVPAETVLIGTLKIGDNGFSKSGILDTTLRLARPPKPAAISSKSPGTRPRVLPAVAIGSRPISIGWTPCRQWRRMPCSTVCIS